MTRIYKFHSLYLARCFAVESITLKMVILGNDGLLWVVTPAHAERLLRQGYELAR